MLGLDKPKLCAKFEIASFSRCRNIKEDPKILGNSLAQGHTHFSFWWNSMMGKITKFITPTQIPMELFWV